MRAIVISGSMGSGKTTLLGEASDLLAARGVAHGAVDLDAINTVLLSGDVSQEVGFANLAAVCGNFRGAGVDTVLIAAAIESAAELERLKRALPDAAIVVCRLTAAVATLEQRLRVREPGMQQDQFVARSRQLHEVLERASVEDFVISNDRPRSITAVAQELLERAGWFEGSGGGHA
jgi:predicted kinase